VRIDSLIHPLQRDAASFRQSRANQASSAGTLSDRFQVDDVVQLTLTSDGIWEVTATSVAAEELATPAHDSPGHFPGGSRLYHSLLNVYSSAGLIHANQAARGLLVDMYV
jgi:hypothetical protein